MIPGSPPMKKDAKKIEILGKHVAYGGTGGQGAGQRIHDALTSHAAKMGVNKPSTDVTDVIRRIVNPIQLEVHSEWVQLPGTQPESWGALFCGWSSDGPWIYEVDPSGKFQFHDPYATTGSGFAVSRAALVSVEHFRFEEQSVDQAKVVAYRAVENTCNSSAFGVGMPVQMAVVIESGVELLNDGDEIHEEFKVSVDLWRAQEAEIFGKLAPTPPSAETPAAETAPEPPSIDESEIEPYRADRTVLSAVPHPYCPDGTLVGAGEGWDVRGCGVPTAPLTSSTSRSQCEGCKPPDRDGALRCSYELPRLSRG